MSFDHVHATLIDSVHAVRDHVHAALVGFVHAALVGSVHAALDIVQCTLCTCYTEHAPENARQQLCARQQTMCLFKL